MPGDVDEVVEHATVAVDRGPHLLLRQRRRALHLATVPVVRPVDGQHVEAVGQRLDLPQEVLGGEAALPQRVGQRVARGRERDPCLGEPPEQRRHEHRVAGVVELELVDADQPVAAQRLDGGGEAERPHEVGVLDEGAERLGTGGLVPQAREQVRLAHAEPAVEVDAATCAGRGRPPEPSSTRPLPQPRGIRLQALHRGGLARLCRVGTVGVEALRPEARRRHEVAHQPVTVQPR